MRPVGAGKRPAMSVARVDSDPPAAIAFDWLELSCDAMTAMSYCVPSVRPVSVKARVLDSELKELDTTEFVPCEYARATYAVMGAPPSLSGAFQETTTSLVPSACASISDGALGRPGTTAVTTTESPVPAVFVAEIDMSYDMPTVNPVVRMTAVAEPVGEAVARCVVVPVSTTTTL